MAVIKPTVTQYNRSFASLRQESKNDYNTVRTWILDGNNASGSGATSITYSDLVILLAGSGATPGTLYLINDFATRQIIPNSGGFVNQGAIEPLIVMAASTSELSSFAISSLFPTDLITYDFNSSAEGNNKGKITFRKDTVKNNSSFFDLRVYKFRRWFDGTFFTLLTQAASPLFEDNQIFSSLASNCESTNKNGNANNQAQGVQVNITIGDAQNITILEDCELVEIGDNGANIIIYQQCIGVYIRPDCFNVEIRSNCEGVNLSNNVSEIFIDNNCINIALEQFVNTVSIQTASEGIQIDQSANNINIGSTNKAVYVGKFCKGLDTNNANENISVGYQCSGIVININCFDVSIGNDCQDIIINQDCNNLKFFNTVSTRTVSAGQKNRIDTRTTSDYDMLIIFGTAPLPGLIGLYPIDTIEVGAYVTYSVVQALSTIIGAGANISLGVAIDDPTGLINNKGLGNVLFNGTPQVATPNWNDNNFTVVTTAQRNFLLTIANANITAGSLLIKAHVEYNN